MTASFLGTVALLAIPQLPRSEMDQLLADYRAYGLPLPPPASRLVRFPHRQQPVDDDAPKDYVLAFQLPASSGDKAPILLVGSVYKTARDWELEEIVAADPVTENLNRVGAEVDAALNIKLNGGLATAIQCYALGWQNLSSKLQTLSLAEPIGDPYFDRFFQPAAQPARKALAAMAFAHWASELTKPERGLAEILSRLRYIVTANPQLDDEPNRRLLVSVEASLRPQRSTPGSVESVIDDLTEPGGVPEPLREFEDGVNPYYLQLVERGFDAVPALIAHVEDVRLTRRESHYIPSTVGTFVLLALNALSDDQRISNPRDAAVWWEQARAVGEENYLLGHRSQEIWRVLSRKYPRHMPDVYRRFLAAPSDYEFESYLLAKLVANCSIATSVKIAALEDGAHHPLFVHRVYALSQIAALNAHSFAELLANEFEVAPATTAGKFGEESPAARLAQLVLETDNQAAWDAMAAAAMRADVGLRMDYIQPDPCCSTGKRQRSRRIEFLEKFLGDETVRDVEVDSGRYSGLHAGCDFPRLEVRNLAAMELAPLLNVSGNPRPGWSPEEWARFRNRIWATAIIDYIDRSS